MCLSTVSHICRRLLTLDGFHSCRSDTITPVGSMWNLRWGKSKLGDAGLDGKTACHPFFLGRRWFIPPFDEDPAVGSSVNCVSPFLEGAALETFEGCSPSFCNGWCNNLVFEARPLFVSWVRQVNNYNHCLFIRLLKRLQCATNCV